MRGFPRILGLMGEWFWVSRVIFYRSGVESHVSGVCMDECVKCGRCCSHLRIGDEESGLTLFPDEIHLFPEEKVRPHLGKGENDASMIFTYQHTENVCVHFIDNMCNIYERRPLMCRSFPVRLGANGLRFAPGCKAVLDIMRSKETMDSRVPEVEAAMQMAERLLEYHRGFAENDQKWKYSLVSEGWEPMKL